MQADGALVEFAGIEDAMDGLEGVDGAGMRGIHLDGFRGLDRGFAESDVLMHDVKILDQQTADGDGHPAVLVAVVVDGTGLADFPADGDQFVERSLVDQVAGVVLAVPGEIGRERVGMYRGVLQESAELLGLIEGGLGKLAEFGYEIWIGTCFTAVAMGCSGKSIAQAREKPFTTGDTGSQA